MKKIVQFLGASVLFENPALSLFVGITPLLASTATLLGGVFMGLSALVSICASCVLFRLLKKLIPDSVKEFGEDILAESPQAVIRCSRGSAADAWAQNCGYPVNYL